MISHKWSLKKGQPIHFEGQLEYCEPCVFRHWCTKILIDLVLWPALTTRCSPAANGEIAAFYLWSQHTLAGHPSPSTALSGGSTSQHSWPLDQLCIISRLIEKAIHPLLLFVRYLTTPRVTRLNNVKWYDNELGKRLWLLWALSWNFVDGLTKTKEHLREDSQCPGWD
jgi:hypothetical protein